VAVGPDLTGILTLKRITDKLGITLSDVVNGIANINYRK
jgi:hypothetical protein